MHVLYSNSAQRYDYFLTYPTFCCVDGEKKYRLQIYKMVIYLAVSYFFRIFALNFVTI